MHHHQRVAHSPGPTHFCDDRLPCAPWWCCPLVRPCISQHLMAPPMAPPNDKNPAVMQFSMCCECWFSHCKSCTTSDQQWNELDRSPTLGCGCIERYHESLSCSWYNMTAPSWRWTDRLVFCRIPDVARTLQQETEISLATPLFVAYCRATLPSFSFGILQYRLTEHEVHLTLMQSSDNNTWAWRARMQGNSRMSERNGIKTMGNEAMSYVGWYEREL